EIYRDPQSPFVADFIGLMNFVAGIVVRPGTVRCGRVDLACESDGFPAGTRVTVAIRPEDIGVQGVQGTEENALPARVAALGFLRSFFRADPVGDGVRGAPARPAVCVGVG